MSDARSDSEFTTPPSLAAPMSIHEQIIERMGTDPDSVVDDILRLASAARTLAELYPRFRDDPSDEDLLAWLELGAASDVFLRTPKMTDD